MALVLCQTRPSFSVSSRVPTKGNQSPSELTIGEKVWVRFVQFNLVNTIAISIFGTQKMATKPEKENSLG